MDRFLKRPADGEASPSPSKKMKKDAKQGNISAAFRAQEFKTHFYESGGKLFCKTCNVVVDHTRKFVIKQHLASKKHTEKAANIPAQLRMKTMKAVINHRTDAELFPRVGVIEALSEIFRSRLGRIIHNG